VRKTTAYARKRQHRPVAYNAAEWLNAIGRCRPFDSEPIIGSWLPGTAQISTGVLVEARMAYQQIKDGLIDSEYTDAFDMLAHVLGVSKIRAIEIAGEDAEVNYILPPLYAAEQAMHRVRERWESTQRWGFDGPGITEMADALDIYEAIMERSSPQQMANATQARIEILKKMRRMA
jgi:hypothetical protein